MQLPSPIPHPLAWWSGAPGIVVDALEWVVGVDWPEGNEKLVWDLADHWYKTQGVLAPAVDLTINGGRTTVAGFGGPDTAIGAVLDQAWLDIAGNPDSDLQTLVQLCLDIGGLIESCGTDIQAAKIEMYIELGIMAIELIATIAAAIATLGAASAAAPAITAVARWSIQQIFKRLLHKLLIKAIKSGAKEAVERVMKKAAEKRLTNFAMKAGRHALEEGLEEIATDFGTQTYQIQDDRRHGYDTTSLALSAAGGAAGGVFGGLAHLGPHADGGLKRFGESVVRGMGGEVLAETGAGLVTGQGLPSVGNLARSATSGGVSGTLDGTRESLADKRADLLADRAGGVGGGPGPVDLTALAGPAPVTTTGANPLSGGGSDGGAGGSVGGSGGSGGGTGGFDGGAGGAGAVTVVGTGQDGGAGGATYTGTTYAGGTHGGGSTVDLAGTALAPESTVYGVGGSTPGAHGLLGQTTDGTGLPGHGTTAPGTGVSGTNVSGPGQPSGGPTVAGGPIGSPAMAPASGGSLSGSPASGALGAPSPTSFATPSTPGSSNPAGSPGLAPTAPPPAGTRPTVPTTTSPTTTSLTTTSPTTTSPPTPTPGTSTSPSAPVAPSARAATTTPSADVPRQRVDLNAAVLAPPVIGRAHPGPGPTAAGPSRPTPAGPGRRRLTENEAEQIRQDRVALWGEAEQTRRFDRRDELANRIRPDVEARLNNVRIELQESIDERDFGKADRIEQDQVLPLQRERNAVDDELATVLGDPFGAVITVPTDLHATLNNDYAVTVAGGVDTDATSALTGTGGPPPVEQSRAYGEPGGHRQPLEYDQQVVEDLIPRDGDGRPQRLPNPFARWFAKMNDSGPGADPTRGINCVDCVLSLFDTWLHGRPRVAAPRTFDAYRDGDVRQPLYGELGGLTRARDVLGTDFTTTYLADTTGGLDPETVYTERIGELERALLDAGHGSFAMIANEWRDGGGHTWAAVNYQGQVVYLDPQHGIADYRPIHNTLGPHGLTRLDIAIVDGAGRPVGVTPDPLRSPWRGGDPTGHPTSDEPHMAGTPDAATDGSIAPVGLAPVGPDDPADPASRPLRQRMLDPYDGSADASAAYSDTPTSPPPAQPWDGWKEQEGAAWRDQSVAEVATGFDLAEDPGAVATLTEAYELTRDQIAPFVVQVAAEMLIDFRTAVAENPARKIVFVGRDGDSLALAIHQLDRDFFDAHCTQITLSRKLAMMAVLDAEAQRHRSLERDGIVASEDDVRIAPAGFRWDFRSEAPENTTDALADLEDYLESQGVPLDEGSAVTIVDSSFKGTVQEILNALFPRISFAGAYIWHGQSAGDPHPGSKTGYATSLADPRPPDAVDPKWETVTYEDTLRGPLASPSGFENGRPVQGPESGDNPTSGIHRRLIAERFRNAPGPVGPGTAPRARLRDAILAVNREAIRDYARHIASESDPGAELFAGFQAYRRQTWRWMHLLMAHPPGVPDRYVTFLDSFVRGGAGGTHRRRSDAQPPPGSDQAAAAPTPQAMEEM